jgi:hypothetical protein
MSGFADEYDGSSKKYAFILKRALKIVRTKRKLE